tara:strand:- start:496 stop:1131 length:636 start_codon:yes stop_codon:yes gene_type:complete
MTNDISVVKTSDLDNVERDIKWKHEETSHTKTPKNQVKSRPDGFDYVEDTWMRQQLNEIYPIWSWTKGKLQFLGSEWVIASGELQVVDKGGIVRKYISHGGARIQFKRGKPHTPDFVVDIDKNVASANTNALKRAINRLCNVADDIYRKEFHSPLELEQSNEIINLASKLNREEDFREQISKEQIHKANFDAAKAKLKRLISQKIKETNND